MPLRELEPVLYNHGNIKVTIDETAVPLRCFYRYTNEPYSVEIYPKVVDSETLIGIIGGGEQLLSCAGNPKVKEMIGLDNNITQVALCLAKVSLSCQDKKETLDFAKNHWYHDIGLEKIMEEYQRSIISSYQFENIYENLRKRFKEGNLKLTLIAGDALKILPTLKSSNATVYLSNLPDCIESHQALLNSLENFLRNNCTLILSGLVGDYYVGLVEDFVDFVLRNRENYRVEKIKAFDNCGHGTLDEIVYTLRSHR